MESIYLDNHLFVVNKKAGMATQPDLHALAKQWIKEKYGKPGAAFLEPIHRLDKPVSGLVLFARTSKALSRLNEAMREHKIRKKYFACVEGDLKCNEGLLEHFLMHDEYRAKIVDASHPEAKKALLSYQVIRRMGTKSLLEIELVTGRYHQIRAQLSAIGHPIVGDVKYGSQITRQDGTILLHHGQLNLIHPVTQQPLLFSNLDFNYK